MLTLHHIFPLFATCGSGVCTWNPRVELVRDPGSPNLRMVSWKLNTLRFGGDCTPQSSDKVIGSLGKYESGHSWWLFQIGSFFVYRTENWSFLSKFYEILEILRSVFPQKNLAGMKKRSQFVWGFWGNGILRSHLFFLTAFCAFHPVKCSKKHRKHLSTAAVSTQTWRGQHSGGETKAANIGWNQRCGLLTYYRCWWLMRFLSQLIEDYELHWQTQ